MSIKEAVDHYEAEFRIFPLHPFNQDGSCGCGIDDCPTAGKHPKISRWQNVPHWSEEQFNNMYEYSIEQGYGIICDNHIVLDVDKRNGGFESLAKINKDLGVDFESISQFVVETGGGGLHIFFKAPEGVALVSHHKKYAGIDFKSGSGSYLVGCGSLHKSGAYYEKKKGFPQDIEDAPGCLIELLKKPERVRARVTDREFIDISEKEITDLLSYITPDCQYDDWISIGMGLHDATSGSGFHLWDDWSAKGSNYQPDTMDAHWQSFGKCSNPITVGSVIHHARAGGWKQPIDLNLPDTEEHETDGLPFAIDSVDLLRPVGFVGEVTNWINSQCRYPREKLAVMSALNVVGNIGAMRYEDEYNGIESNTIFFGVAASGSGKDAILKATSQLFRETGLASAIHGGIKSEQEIVRNLVRNQAAYYMIDELGIQLKKIMNAGKSGASYLEAAIGTIMSVYTKSDDAFLISGDVKDDIRNSLIKEAAQCQKKVHENEDEHGHYARRFKHLNERAIPSIDNGLERPYLSVLGYTTPSTFDSLMGQDMAENGFMSRAFIVREAETNPKRKRGFKKAPIDRKITATLKTIYCGGVGCEMDRVEWNGDRVSVKTTEEAASMLEGVADWFEEDGDKHKAKTGLEALSRRGYELVAKISYILAIPSRIREPEHVRWAFAYVKSNYEDKVRLAQTNILSDSNDVKDATTVLMNRILDICSGDEGEPISVIKQRCGKKYSPTDIAETVQKMIDCKLLECVESQSARGRKRERYRKI